MIKTSIRLSVASPMAASRVEGGKLERDTQKMSMRSMLIGILMGGLIAVTIDIGSACLINGRAPAVILRVIASGPSREATSEAGRSSESRERYRPAAYAGQSTGPHLHFHASDNNSRSTPRAHQDPLGLWLRDRS
jgi:hypothetical protein